MTHKLFKSLVFCCLLVTSSVMADDKDKDKDKEKYTPGPNKGVCFNILCNYQRKHHDDKDDDRNGDRNKGRYETCRSAAKFFKYVGVDGREVRDTSKYPNNPEFEVECDNMLIFNNSATRFTDEQGTRIQAQKGPYPATLLPRHALREGHRYALSTLELEDQVLKGHCYVYSTSAF